MQKHKRKPGPKPKAKREFSPRRRPPVSFNQLNVGDVIHHAGGARYRIVHVDDDGQVFANYMDSHMASWGRKVVRLVPAHIREFRLSTST